MAGVGGYDEARRERGSGHLTRIRSHEVIRGEHRTMEWIIDNVVDFAIILFIISSALVPLFRKKASAARTGTTRTGTTRTGTTRTGTTRSGPAGQIPPSAGPAPPPSRGDLEQRVKRYLESLARGEVPGSGMEQPATPPAAAGRTEARDISPAAPRPQPHRPGLYPG
ncbi:MAG: hypothetical protein AB1486_33640, partial [Planctomycetota bacterium]